MLPFQVNHQTWNVSRDRKPSYRLMILIRTCVCVCANFLIIIITITTHCHIIIIRSVHSTNLCQSLSLNAPIPISKDQHIARFSTPLLQIAGVTCSKIQSTCVLPQYTWISTSNYGFLPVTMNYGTDFHTTHISIKSLKKFNKLHHFIYLGGLIQF